MMVNDDINRSRSHGDEENYLSDGSNHSNEDRIDRKRKRQDSRDWAEKYAENSAKNDDLRSEINTSVDERDRSTRTPKVGSAVGAVVNQANRVTRNDVDHSPATASIPSIQDKKTFIEDTNKKPEILGRNKRMFGSLMGHLGLAKSTLEKESQKIHRQQQYLQEITKRHEEDQQRLEIQRRKEKKQAIYDQQRQEEYLRIQI